jgi:hypothetical protein
VVAARPRHVVVSGRALVDCCGLQCGDECGCLGSFS